MVEAQGGLSLTGRGDRHRVVPLRGGRRIRFVDRFERWGHHRHRDRRRDTGHRGLRPGYRPGLPGHDHRRRIGDGHRLGHGRAGGYGVALYGTNGDSPQPTIGSGGGAVSVTGTGTGRASDGGYDDGVYVADGALITAGGSGVVTVVGTGGPGDGESYGVRVTGGGLIDSSGGQVSVTGTGGGHAGDGGYDVGVGVEAGGQITSTGPVNVTGTGGPGGGLDYGVLVSSDGTDRQPGVVTPENSTSTMITSSAGLTVTGQGGGSNGSQGYDDGIHVDSGGVISDTRHWRAHARGHGRGLRHGRGRRRPGDRCQLGDHRWRSRPVGHG